MAYLYFKLYYFILSLILKHRQTNVDIGRTPNEYYQEMYNLHRKDIQDSDPSYNRDYTADVIYDSRNYRIIYTRFKTFRLIFKDCARVPVSSSNLNDIIEQMFYRDIFR